MLVQLKKHKHAIRYQQGEEKDSDTENDRENGLRMKNEMKMKEKRFSFFSNPQERKAESRPTFGTLPFAQNTSQRFAKGKEPNLPTLHFIDYVIKCLFLSRGCYPHFFNLAVIYSNINSINY